MNKDGEVLTAVVLELRRRTRKRLLIAMIPLVLALVLFSLYRQQSQVNRPVEYANDEDHFKYGSIGSDTNGIPYLIWKTMPEVCESKLAGGYASLGVIQEPGRDTPIGFSVRRVGPVDQVGPNCALCHTASVRSTEAAAPEIYLTAPASQLNLMRYFKFLFDCGRDPNFTTTNFLAAIDKHNSLGIVDRLIYRIAVPRVRDALVKNAPKFDAITARRVAWGPGRVDTFNPYKVLLFNLNMDDDESVGTADFMSIWNQQPREGIWLHWDGNNDSVDERNLSAAIGAGATPETLNLDGIMRIKRWILARPAPPYPFPIDYAKVAAGKPVYDRYCASCHDVGGRYFGAVTPLRELGTDPARNKSFDGAMAERMNSIGKEYPWHFHRFRPTDGYANHPLDGIWLRGPYLHNGSVPTLRDLLKPQSERPPVFFRGNDVFDTRNIGFVSNVAQANGRTFFEFDTRQGSDGRNIGNDNGGHLYGIALPESDKDALIEYLKTR